MNYKKTIKDLRELNSQLKSQYSDEQNRNYCLQCKIDKLEKENQQLKEQLEASEKARKEAIELLSIVYGISVDYDGFNDVAGLKSVIDDMARFTKKAKNILDIDKGE